MVFLVVMLLFLAVGGLGMDASNLLVHRTYQSMASSAARAGAIQVDEAAIYSRADGVFLDPLAARRQPCSTRGTTEL